MTDIVQARAIAYERFLDEWGSRTVISLDGEPFDQADPDQLPEGAPWVRVSVKHLASEQVSLGQTGNRKFNRSAIVFIQIFIPINTGMKPVDDLIKPAIAVYEGARVDGLVFGASTPRELSAEGVYQPVVVETRFDYEEVK